MNVVGLSDEERTILRKETDNDVFNCIHELNLEGKDQLRAVILKIQNAGQLENLHALLRRNINMDDHTIDENFADVH